MTRRITIKGVQVGRIDEDLCSKYEAVCENPIYKDLLEILETTFRIRIKGKEELDIVTERLKNLHYTNICEWYKGVMRARVEANVGEKICPFACKECAKFNCGEDHPIMKDKKGNTWNYCPEWQCGVDGDNNKGIEHCFTVR